MSSILSERMEQFQFLCEVSQILAPVTLCAPDTLMTSHVLNPPDIVCFEPVHYTLTLIWRLSFITGWILELLQQFKAVEQMNDADRTVIKRLIDAFITKAKIKQLA